MKGKFMFVFVRFQVTCYVNGRYVCDILLTTSQGEGAAKRRAQMALIVNGYADLDDEFEFVVVGRDAELPAEVLN